MGVGRDEAALMIVVAAVESANLSFGVLAARAPCRCCDRSQEGSILQKESLEGREGGPRAALAKRWDGGSIGAYELCSSGVWQSGGEGGCKILSRVHEGVTR